MDAASAKKKEKEKDLHRKAHTIYKEACAMMKRVVKKEEFLPIISKFTEAISLRPAYSYYFFARGNAYRNIGDFKRCLLDYTMSIRIEDKIPAFYGLW